MRLFDTFSLMIARTPIQVVTKALELQRELLEEDILNRRPLPMDEVTSILSFCRFVEAAKAGVQSPPIGLPGTHISFYRETTVRLVEANVLPVEACHRFDVAFSKRSLKVKPAVSVQTQLV